MSVLNLRISNDKHKSAIKQQYKEEAFISVINKLGEYKIIFYLLLHLAVHLSS